MCIAVYIIQRVIFVYIPLQPKVLFDQPSIFGLKKTYLLVARRTRNGLYDHGCTGK